MSRLKPQKEDGRDGFTGFDDARGKRLKASKGDAEKKMEREKRTREKRRKAG